MHHIVAPRKRLLTIIALTAASALALTGCSAKSSDDSSPTATTLTIAVGASNANLDPTQAGTGWPLSLFAETAYDPLILQKSDGSFAPSLATKWSYTGTENKEFSLTLRKGVTFSDGSDLTAAGVKQWMEFAATQSGTGAGVFKNITSIDFSGKDGLVLHLAASDGELPFELSQNRYGFPTSPKVLSTPKQLQSATFGAGPYVLDKAGTVAGTTYSYSSRKGYWNPSGQHWKKVVITIVKDTNAALSAVQSGQQMLTALSPQLAPTAKSAGLTITNASAFFDGLLVMDRGGVLVPQLKDPRVRQAMNYAIDRKAVAKSIFGSYADATPAVSVKGLQSYSSDLSTAYTYDVAKAKSLLAEAGYPKGFTLPIGVIPLGGQELNFVQAVDGYLAAIGITVQLKQYTDPAAAFTALLGGKVAVIPVTTFELEDSDLITRETLLPGSSALEPFKSPDPQLAALYETAGSSTGAARTKALRDLQSHFVTGGYYVGVSTSDIIFASSDKLSKFTLTSKNHFPVLGDLTPAK